MPKKMVRDEVLARRKSLSSETCILWSLAVQKRFIELDEFHSAEVLALYSPVLNEVFTEEIFRIARLQGKVVAYPRVRGEYLNFVRIDDRRELLPGAFGVLEPAGGELISVACIDLLVVPGVAFDAQGFRLGYGKGFYDRALHLRGSHAVTAGLCFEAQVVPSLPAEDHDVQMDVLVTEERTLYLKNTAERQ